MLKLLELLNGSKSYAGAVVQMLTGAGAILAALAAMIIHFTDPTNPTGLGLDAGVAALVAGAYIFGKGLEAFGMAHKTEKQTEAITDQTVEIKKQTAASKAQTKEVVKQTEAIEENK